MRPTLALLLLALPLACASVHLEISEAEQARAKEELEGQKSYLRVATFVGPLWDDTEKAFLTDRPASELDLVETPGGKPILPPPFERVLGPGTKVRIDKIEFPSTWMANERVLVTPRYDPWVYLEVEGEKRPGVIVLPQNVKSFDDLRADLERYLTPNDPGPALAALPPEMREMVLKKEAVPGMSGKALEMAWGLPERKWIDKPAGTEDWYWEGGKRHAFLRQGRVEKVDR